MTAETGKNGVGRTRSISLKVSWICDIIGISGNWLEIKRINDYKSRMVKISQSEEICDK